MNLAGVFSEGRENDLRQKERNDIAVPQYRLVLSGSRRTFQGPEYLHANGLEGEWRWKGNASLLMGLQHN